MHPTPNWHAQCGVAQEPWTPHVDPDRVVLLEHLCHIPSGTDQVKEMAQPRRRQCATVAVVFARINQLPRKSRDLLENPTVGTHMINVCKQLCEEDIVVWMLVRWQLLPVGSHTAGMAAPP